MQGQNHIEVTTIFTYEEEPKIKVNLLISSCNTACDKCKVYHFSTQSPPFFFNAYYVGVPQHSDPNC